MGPETEGEERRECSSKRGIQPVPVQRSRMLREVGEDWVRMLAMWRV